MSVQSHIENLRAKLHAANEDYYTHDRPTMADAEFDRALAELKQLELQHPEYNDPNSPTSRVGGRSVEGFTKAKHAVKMLSLDNAFTPEEILSFFGKPVDVILEPKIDGLSLSLRYQRGMLVSAVTRGNGDEGDVVTDNARTIRSIPLVLPEQMTLEVRGEVYLPKTRFAALNAEREAAGEELFANPRNAASGTMKLKDSREVAKRGLGFCAYRIIGTDAETEAGALEILKELGFETPLEVPVVGKTERFCAVKYICANQHSPVPALTGSVPWCLEVQENLRWLDSHRHLFEYELDGAVFKLDDISQQNELADGTKSPKWAVAYKYPPEEKMTRLQAIECTVGKSGQICPNARLDPVMIEGSLVANASLMNLDEIQRVGGDTGLAVGDLVVVVKSGCIIPRVTRVGAMSFSPVREVWTMPKTCPCCDTTLERRGVHFFCPNHLKCPDQIFGRLKHATSKATLDWDGMGDAQVAGFVEQGVSKLSHLFEIETPKGLSPAALKKFIKERERVKSAPLWRKLAALGIEGIGTTLCKEMSTKYRSIVAIAEATEDELRNLIGPVNTANLRSFLENNASEIERLSELGLSFEEAGTAGPLSGKEFVITGTLISGSRSAVAAKIESAGGIVKGSVSRKTSYLVSGSSGGANKAAAAAKHGTVCLTESQLYALLGTPMSSLKVVDEKYEL
jgi:DNA ligase (NAD+)